MYFVDSLWSFLLVWAVIGATGINIGLSMPLDVAITNWFVKKRGTGDQHQVGVLGALRSHRACL